MPGLKVILDPEDAALLFEADEDGKAGFFVMSPLKVPRPEREQQWTSNADTEGELAAGGRDKNIEIPPKLRIVGRDEADFRERQIQLAQKLDRYSNGEGGTLRLIFPDGKTVDYEIRGVKGGEGLIDNRYMHSWRAEEEVTFICGPYGVGEEILVGEYSGSGRVLECVVDEVPGTATALARAEVVSPGADIWELLYSRDSRYFDPEEETALAGYAAKDLTPLGGATATTATVDGKAGVSVVRVPLTPNWTAGLSTNLAAGGSLTHQGVYDWYVWLHMPASNTGEVAALGEYGLGDLSISTELEPVYFPAGHTREGKVVRLKLGQVWLRAPSRGEHQWEGRLVFKSTVPTDVIDVLDVGLRPVEELNGGVAVTPSLRQPVALLTRDGFEQSGGNLNGKIIAAAASLSGPLTPGTVVEDAAEGSQAWVNPGNAAGTADGSYASSSNVYTEGKGISTKILKATNPGFAIPGTATIDGIQVGLLRKSSQGYTISFGSKVLFTFLDEWLRLVKAGSYVGAKKKAAGEWPTSTAWATYGGPKDLWETTWTPAQVNSANFGAALKATPPSISSDSAGRPTAFVDAFQITVYYTDAAGQTWATTGDAVDLTVDEAEDVAKRSEVNDASLTDGRYAVAGTTVTADVVAGIRAKRSGMTVGAGERVRAGTMARYVDTSNWLFFGLDAKAESSPLEETLRVLKRKGGGEPVELAKISIPTQFGLFRSFFLQVDRRGRWYAWGALLESGIPRLLAAGQDNDLAAGGALDDGKNGFYGVKTGGNACTLTFDDFVVWVPPLEAVAFEGRTLEVSHDSVQRETIDGGRWLSLTPEIDYLKLAPSGMENRKNRLTFIASPHDPDLMGVGFPSELKVALYVTPRYRGVPDPA